MPTAPVPTRYWDAAPDRGAVDEARIEFATAIALDRNNAHAMLGLGQTLMFLVARRTASLRSRTPCASIRATPTSRSDIGRWGPASSCLATSTRRPICCATARAENPRVYFFHIYLAAAFGLHGDIDEARAALAEAVRLNPAASSLAQLLTTQPWLGNPAFAALRNSTFDLGLRRAGMPDT